MSIKICSIAPEEFKIKRSYNWNGIVLPACKPGERYSSLTIDDHWDTRVVAVDHWSEHSEKTPVKITAKEIVSDFFANENLKNKGAFITVGDEPDEDELATAHETRRAYLMQCVNEGQAEYSKSGRIENIPGEWKRAAAELGMDLDWAKRMPLPTFECPVCAETLRQGVAVCKSCGAILNKSKAEQYGLIEKDAPVKKAGAKLPETKNITV